MTGHPWGPGDVPDLGGRRALVTGTSPLAERTVVELARHRAEVIVGGPDPTALDDVVRRARDAVPGAAVTPLEVDVADLTSVRHASSRVSGVLHLLVHATVPSGDGPRTADGLDPQLATHHFGPFALTGLLFPRLVASGDARVVTLGSPAGRLARRAPLHDPFEPDGRDGGRRGSARAGLAALMFAVELDRRAAAGKVPVRAVAAQPGRCSGPDADPRLRTTSTIGAAARALTRQPAELAARILLMAATADLPGSAYVGPGAPGHLRGEPRVLRVPSVARDDAARRRLWEISEETTGVRFLG